MSKGRSLKAIAAGALVSVALVACGGAGRGGSTAPSALDPANMVPASAVLYASVTIRPQGSIQKNLIQAVNSIAGAGTAQSLGGKLDKELGAKLGKQFSLLKSWLGQRIGVALIGFPSNFTDPGAAQLFLDDLLVVAPQATHPPLAGSWHPSSTRRPGRPARSSATT